MLKITIYTKTGCPWCQGVLDLLKENSIDFEERNVSENSDYLNEMIEKSSQTKAPTLIINDDMLADSDRDEVEAYLKTKGVL